MHEDFYRGSSKDDHLSLLFSENDFKTGQLRLRELVPSDYPFLYRLSASPEGMFRWRYRGPQPGFEEFVRSLRTGVLVQFVIAALDSNTPVGLVVCYGADFRNRHAYVALQATPGQSSALGAAALFVDFLFRSYDFDKLYAELIEYTFRDLRSGIGRVFELEGHLRGHERFLGRSWDKYLVAIYRSSWTSLRAFSRESLITSDSTDPSSRAKLTEEQFVETLRVALELEGEPLQSSSRLVEDLDFDSIRFFELAALIEEMGVKITDIELRSLETVEDAYRIYRDNKPLPTDPGNTPTSLRNSAA
jgi:acyl carrier protein/RimJ/RimL family protein N-acetyltransferase